METKKKKRIVTKIGNIFCVEIRNEYKEFKCYFQYVANDMTQLNSSVIRVFKKRYHIDAEPSMEEIVKDEVSFYVHTVLRVGIMTNSWYKVGTSKEIGETDNIMFRTHDDVNYHGTGKTKSYKWRVWRIGGEMRLVGEMNDTYRKYHLGWVFPYLEVVAKIETGEYLSHILD